MSGTVYLKDSEIHLINHAFDILESDYDNEQDSDTLEEDRKIFDNLLYKINKLLDK